jgi:hypothetical protein
MRTLILAALTLFAGTTSAQEAPLLRVRDVSPLLAATALNGGPSFTITNPGGGYAKALLTIVRTRAAGTDLTMTCSQSRDGGTTYAKMQTCEYTAASGTCTHYDVTWKSPTSTTETLSWEVAIAGQPLTRCTFASTSSNGSDTSAVTGMLVTQ